MLVYPGLSRFILRNRARKVRLEVLGKLRSRLKTGVAEGELPASTDIDGPSRFDLSVFQGMAIQARDGATQAELRSIAAAAMTAWPSNGGKQAVGNTLLDSG